MRTLLVNKVRCQIVSINENDYVLVGTGLKRLYWSRTVDRCKRNGIRYSSTIKKICEHCHKEFFNPVNKMGRFCGNSCGAKFHVSYKNANKNRLPSFKGSKELKQKAVNFINHAITAGRIIRPTQCEHCGIKCIPDFHHPDSAKFNEGMWLYRECHNKLHHGYKIEAPIRVY